MVEVKRDLKRVWAPLNFRKLVYEKKAECPDKTIPDILDEIADREREQVKKQRGFKYF